MHVMLLNATPLFRRVGNPKEHLHEVRLVHAHITTRESQDGAMKFEQRI